MQSLFLGRKKNSEKKFCFFRKYSYLLTDPCIYNRSFLNKKKKKK